MNRKNKDLQVIQTLHQKMNNIDFNFDHAAKKVGFTQRTPKKIFPESLCKSLLLLTFKARISFASWATLLSLNLTKIVSCQAINKRINTHFVELMKMALASLIKNHAQSEELKSRGLFVKFKRVILQDSTTIKVSNQLSKFYPGGANHTNKKSSIISRYLLYYVFP